MLVKLTTDFMFLAKPLSLIDQTLNLDFLLWNEVTEVRRW